MIDEVRPNCPELRHGGPDRQAETGTSCWRTGRGGDRAELAAAPGRAEPRRPDQHPVHVRHHRLPEGRHAVAPQHPQQRLLRRTSSAATPDGPGLHPGAVLPLLRHGDGQPRRAPPTARRWSSPAPASIRRRRSTAVAQERCTSLYGVPTMFIAELQPPRLRRLRPVVAAHRDHGRLAVPGRGDEAGRRPDGHDRGDDLLRHDRDLAGVDPDPRGRLARAARRRPSAGCTRTSRSRSSIRRPA